MVAALLMRHTISVLVENRFGVLARVAGGFAADRLRRSKEIAVIGYGL